MKPLFLAAAVLAAGAASAGHLDIGVSGAKFSGRTITFLSVTIDKPGYLVIHATADGAPVIAGAIGATMVRPGTTENVKVCIAEPIMNGTGYVAMLHYETNGNTTYEFGEGMTDVDGPALKADGSIYKTMFETGM